MIRFCSVNPGSVSRSSYSTFGLCLLSQKFESILGGSFSVAGNRQIVLDNVDAVHFQQLIDLGCGQRVHLKSLVDAIQISILAERFEMNFVFTSLVRLLKGKVTMRNCALILCSHLPPCLCDLQSTALDLAKSRFQEVAATEDFMNVSAAVLGALIQDRLLSVPSEEHVFEFLVRWIEHDPQSRSEPLVCNALLEMVRFPAMEPSYLAQLCASPAFPASKLQEIVQSAVSLQRAIPAKGRRAYQFGRASRKTILSWPRGLEGCGGSADGDSTGSTGGGGSRKVTAMIRVAGQVFTGSENGEVGVWDIATEALTHSLECPGLSGNRKVNCLAGSDRILVAGLQSGHLLFWELDGAGGGAYALDSQNGEAPVTCLALPLSNLVSGHGDGMLRIWERRCDPGDGISPVWSCNRVVPAHSGTVHSLVAWNGLAMSCAGKPTDFNSWSHSSRHDQNEEKDSCIKVWDVGSGALSAELVGHNRHVTALVVHENRLVSVSRDDTIRTWALGTWKSLEVRKSDNNYQHYLSCMTICGDRLICGTGYIPKTWRTCLGSGMHSYDLKTLTAIEFLCVSSGTNHCVVDVGNGEVWSDWKNGVKVVRGLDRDKLKVRESDLESESDEI
jgi:WD40 repeat protein